MGVNNRASLHPKLSRHVRRTLEGFMWCEFRLFDPNRETASAGFDVWTNTTDTNQVEVWHGRGQMQVFRQTLNAELPAGGITQIRSLRFTVPIAEMQGLAIRKGMKIQIVDVDPLGDQDVKNYLYTVTSGVGAVTGWTRTIEAEVDSGRVI